MPDETETAETAKPEQEPLPAAPRGSTVPPFFASILLHGLILALIIFGLPVLDRFRDQPLGTPPPIAVELVMQDEVADMPASRPAPPQAPSPATQASAPPESEPQAQQKQTAPLPPTEPSPAADIPSAPYDPSFNPYALGKPIEVIDATHQHAPTPPREAPPTEQTSAAAAAAGASSQFAGPADQGLGAGAGQTGPGQGGHGEDPRMRQQYLGIRLAGYIDLVYEPELRRYLRHLIECGVKPLATRDPHMAVEAEADYNIDGTLRGARLLNQAQYAGNADYAAAAERLMTALDDPSCSRILLPPLLHRQWATVRLSFFQKSATDASANEPPPLLPAVPDIPGEAPGGMWLTP